jgi:hypothetical protein
VAAWGLGGGEQTGGALEEAADGAQTEALACQAETGAVRGLLAGAEAAAGFEDLADRQVREDAHSQDHPEDNLTGEAADAQVEAGGVGECLQNAVAADNLFQQEQVIGHASRLICRQCARK